MRRKRPGENHESQTVQMSLNHSLVAAMIRRCNFRSAALSLSLLILFLILLLNSIGSKQEQEQDEEQEQDADSDLRLFSEENRIRIGSGLPP